MALSQRTASTLMLQIKRFAVLVVVAFSLAAGPPALAQPMVERCHDLYVAAWNIRDSLKGHPDHFRGSAAARQRHRDSHRELLESATRAQDCYNQLASNLADTSDLSSRFTSRLDSIAQSRIRWTYFYKVLGHRELNEFDEALEDYDAYFQRFGTSTDSSNLRLMYHMRAYQKHQRGKSADAIGDYIQTLNHIPRADTLLRARTLLDFGIVLLKMDDAKRAYHYFRQAEQLLTAITPPSRKSRSLLARAFFTQADLINNHASAAPISIEEGQADHKAIELILRALETFPEEPDPMDVDTKVRAHTTLGKLYASIGDFDRAFKYANLGQQMAEQLNHYDDLWHAARVKANIYRRAGRPEEAVPLLRRALEFAEQGVTFTDRKHMLSLLGNTHERLGNWSKAEARYRQAVDVIETHRASLRATKWATAAFDDWNTVYRQLTRVLIAQERYREAFATLERSRARNLQDTRLQARVTNKLSPEEHYRYDSLTTALVNTRNRLTQSDLSDDTITDLQTEEAQLMTQRRSLIGLDKINSPALSEVQAHLQAENQTLLSFFLDNASTYRQSRSVVFVVTPDSLHTVPLSVTTDDVEEALPTISPVLGERSTQQEVDIGATRFDLHALHRLHEQLIAPVSDILPESGRLVILPDGPLFRLPFNMLVRETPGRFAYAEAHYLIEDHPIMTELGTGLLTDSTAAPQPTRFDVVAFGQTVFSGETASPEPVRPVNVRSVASARAKLPPLPGVDAEMAALGNLFGNRRLLLNDAAHEEAFYDLQNETKVLHLASHAIVSEDHSHENLFVLSAPPGESEYDGLLYLHELERNRSSVPLVVLSGCSTARGLHQSGEGPIGLQYAFRAMGAQSTLSTLWPADDASAVALTTAFYRHLQAGHPKDIALQRAQQEYLQTNPSSRSPFFWAAPVLYGSPRPLELSEPRNWMYYLSGGFLLLLASLAVVYRRSKRT